MGSSSIKRVLFGFDLKLSVDVLGSAIVRAPACVLKIQDTMLDMVWSSAPRIPNGSSGGNIASRTVPAGSSNRPTFFTTYSQTPSVYIITDTSQKYDHRAIHKDQLCLGSISLNTLKNANFHSKTLRNNPFVSTQKGSQIWSWGGCKGVEVFYLCH